MKKKFIIFLSFILLISSPLFADLAGYYITNYRFDAVLHENNVLSVNEVIDVVFTEPRHGIYRTLPIYFYTANEEEDREMTYAEIYHNISTGIDKHSNSTEGNTFIIKIGNPDIEISGKHTYTISYDCIMPDDRIKSYDFFYYSPLGAFWDTTINQFDFNIRFEKPIPQNSDLQLYSGDTSSTSNLLKVDYKYDSNGISGTVSRIPAKQAITIYVRLPEGYIIGAKKVSRIPAFILAILTLAVLAYSLFLCLTSSTKKPVKTVEFYPPKNIPPSEVGYIIDKSADDSDIMALIPYWAQKGYISISEEKSKKYLKQKTVVTITKKNKLNYEEPEYQKFFFYYLFAKSDTFRFSNLSSKFIDKLDTTKEKLKKEYEEEDKTLYTGESKSLGLLFLSSLMTFLTFALSSQIAYFDNLFLSLFIIPIFFLGCSFNRTIYTRYFKKIKSIFKYIFYAVIIALALYATIQLTKNDNSLPIPVIYVISIMYSLVAIFNGRIIQMTPYNIEITGKLLGLKEFIKVAEVPRLEVLVEENPEYYYDILPYAMVFGLADKWASRFANITIKDPSWYSGVIDPSMHFSAMNLINTIQKDIINPVSATRAEIQSKSRGSSSGGGSHSFGSAGGGGGGGGGGSW